MGIQSILTLGALVLLSLVSLRFNSAVLETSNVETENKVYLTAFSVANDLLEIIKLKGFDEKTLLLPTTNPANLTPVASLGSEGETISSYDDIDDYKGYSKLIDDPHLKDYSYTVSCDVNYVDPANPNNISSVRTFYKLVKVSVSSPYLRKPASLSFIFTLK